MFNRNKTSKTRNMIQLVKVFAVKPDGLSSIPWPTL